MIYIFFGDDLNKRNLAIGKFLATLPEKVTVLHMGKSDFSRAQVEGFISGQSLFFGKSAIILNGIMESDEAKEFIIEKLPELAKSDNLFIFKEGALKKPISDQFKKARAEMNVFEKGKEKVEKFNNFILANALGQRDKLNLWASFREAMELGVGLEELVGVLFWKAKDMLLKRNLGKFKEEELKNFSSKIAYLLPEARREGRDAEAALEEFLLEVV
jgi:hypothetical protein